MLQINEIEEARMISSLYGVIEKWWENENEICENIPWVGDKTYFLMARAAISILQANKDVEVYLDSQEMLKDINER